MTELTPRQIALCVAGVVVMLLLGVSQLRRGGAESAAAPAGGGGGGSAAPIAVEEDGGGGRLVVHVAGAVRDPGVYRLAAGARVDDAVARAGGATRRADLGGLNLAAELEDGRQVLVPERARTGAGGGSAVAGAGSAVAPEPAPGQPLNLNTATLEQLDTLSGIGPLTAQKILEYREELGGFASIEELGEIPGIGEKRLASLREEVTL
jgi:competence protein ComEA